jgi:hypothetical protein
LALESIPITAYGASIGTDSISLDTANTVLDGCFRQTSNLDPAFPPTSLFTATNPASEQVGAGNGTANLVAAGVHVRSHSMLIYNTCVEVKDDNKRHILIFSVSPTCSCIYVNLQAIIGPSCDVATMFAVNQSRDLQVPLLGYHSVSKTASRYDYLCCAVDGFSHC